MKKNKLRKGKDKGKERVPAPILEETQKELPLLNNLNPDFMLQVPNEILVLINSFMDNESRAKLSQTSSQYNGLFKDNLKKAAIETLNTYVLSANKNQTLKMVKSAPDRLLTYGKADDNSNRPFYGTPFQAALLSHDVDLWKVMEKYFDKLPDGQKEKARQVKERFSRRTT